MRQLSIAALLLASLTSCSLVDNTSDPQPSEPAPTNRAPTVNLSATPTSGAAPLTVTFTAQAEDADDDELFYAWSLEGDLNTASVSETFAEPGDYPVTVTVSDGQSSATDSITVTVSMNPEPDPEPDPEPTIELTVVASPGGPVPWGVTYKLSTNTKPAGSTFGLTCAGREAIELSGRDDIAIEADNLFSCIHRMTDEQVVATLTSSAGEVLAETKEIANVKPSSGVAFAGDWEYQGQTGDTFYESAAFAVSENIDEASGQGDGTFTGDATSGNPVATTFTLAAQSNKLSLSSSPSSLDRTLIFVGSFASSSANPVPPDTSKQVFIAPNEQTLDSNEGFLYLK